MMNHSDKNSLDSVVEKTTEEDESINEALLNVLAKQATLVPAPVFLTASVYSYFIYGDLPKIIWVSWVAILVMIVVVRIIVLPKLPTLVHIEQRKRMQIAIVLSLINGCIHGLSLIFFPYFSLAERSVQTLIQLGLTAGSVATTAGYKPFFLTFNIPMVLPIALMWGITPYEGSSVLAQVGISALVLLFFSVQISLANNYFSFFKDSIRIRNERKLLNVQLNNALEKAVLASESKTRFLASASHDLRQPIHTLQLFGTALSMRPLDNKSTEIVGHMEFAIENLASQMDSLLDISKLDAGLIAKKISTLDLTFFLERVCAEMEPIANEKKLKLLYHCENNETFTQTDAEQFERIVRNIISNAIKYTEQGEITVNLIEQQSGYWEFSVSDTGIGIAKEELNKVFEEFYQVGNQERDRNAGLGLGLAIVQRLCHFLDISFSFNSILGKGTTATFLLPKTSADINNRENQKHLGSLNGLNILAIDDESSVRAALKALLEEMGCNVCLAATIQDAIELLTPETDVVLADLRLTGDENGINAIEKIRKLHPDTPAILISGDTAPERLRQADKAGIDMLHKPVKASDLKAAILKQIEQ